VTNGTLLHNDHAKYQLNLQSNVYGGKAVLTRVDSRDIFERIVAYRRLAGEFPIGELAALPTPMKNHVGENPVFKIEWMCNGRYLVSMSDDYANNIILETEIAETSRKHGIPPKLVDYCGLSDYDMAYRMWCESLFCPAHPVSYTGVGFWTSDKKVCYTTVRIMSIVINHEYVITATTCGRGQSFTF
jgi:hypothetical protein